MASTGHFGSPPGYPGPTPDHSVTGQPRWLDLPHAIDSRGTLTAIESELDIPFAVRRMFFLHGLRGDRGGHAHRDTQQLLVAVTGRVRAEITDGITSVDYTLDNPNRALLVAPMWWIRLHDCSAGAVCLVLTDRYFAESQFVRDWDDFLALRQG
jgi:hypothetical protein